MSFHFVFCGRLVCCVVVVLLLCYVGVFAFHCFVVLSCCGFVVVLLC